MEVCIDPLIEAVPPEELPSAVAKADWGKTLDNALRGKLISITRRGVPRGIYILSDELQGRLLAQARAEGAQRERQRRAW